MPPAPNAGSPLPGQYAFYPAEVAQPGGDLPGDPQVQLVQVTDQLEEPVNVAAPMDGTGRIFVVERGGKIKIVQPDGTVLRTHVAEHEMVIPQPGWVEQDADAVWWSDVVQICPLS